MKSRNVQRKIMIMVALVLLTLSLTTATAFASVMANFSYTATGNGLGNWWDYKLTVSNTTASNDAAADLFYFNFDVNQGASFAGFSLPEGWYGPVWDGSTYVNSDMGYPNLSPDVSTPAGILPGGSLIFTFGLSYLAPEITFNSLVWNLDGYPFDLSSVGTLSSEHPPVPEPSTLLLVGAGLAGAVIWRRKRPAVQA